MAYTNANIAKEIIEQSQAIAIRFSLNADGKWIVHFVSENISQYGYDHLDFVSGKLTMQDILYIDDVLTLRKTITENLLRHIERYACIFHILTSRGAIVCVRGEITVKRDHIGDMLYINIIVSDYSKQREDEQRITEIAHQQDVLNDILVSLHDGDLDQAFNIILSRTGKHLNLSRVLLYEDFPDHRSCRLIYEWCNDGITSLLATGAVNIHYQRDIPEISIDLARYGCGIINFGAIPSESAEEFMNTGVTSSVVFAIHAGDEQYGVICFDECVIERKWPEETLTFLRTISKLVSTAVMRKKNADALLRSRIVMERVLDNIPAYVYVIDQNTREIVFANQAHTKDFPLDANMAKESLHRSISEFCETCPDCRLFAENVHSHYFEVELKQAKKWIGVRCSGVSWTNGTQMRVFSGQDITEKKKHDEFIQHMAYTDHLTGLPNRYRCDFILNSLIADANLNKQKGYVLFIDMDDFKIVNDGYGHHYGDALLIEYARFLSESKPENSSVFRFGGDEFVLLIYPSDADHIQEIIRMLLTRARKPWAVLGKSFYCTLSIGCVAFPDGDMGVKEIIKNADIAMYEAKRLGKNSCVFYRTTMQNDSIERVEMESMLRESIADGFKGFEVYFQPIVDMHTEHIIGAEALVRWFRLDGHVIMPLSFISLCEYLGLIVQIGAFVLRQACAFLRHINENGFPNFTISVNLSIRQLQQEDIVIQVENILEETGVNPKNLVFEITEGLEITGLQRILTILNELHRKGIKLAMDDFGIGYSSLGNMRDLPIDIIKIDRSFVQNINKDTYAHSFIKLIADFSHAMQRRICLEGVETEEQLRYCRKANVDMLQGYFYHMPMPREALLEVLRKPNGDNEA